VRYALPVMLVRRLIRRRRLPSERRGGRREIGPAGEPAELH
jgi:hypothetical protein